MYTCALWPVRIEISQVSESSPGLAIANVVLDNEATRTTAMRQASEPIRSSDSARRFFIDELEILFPYPRIYPG